MRHSKGDIGMMKKSKMITDPESFDNNVKSLEFMREISHNDMPVDKVKDAISDDKTEIITNKSIAKYDKIDLEELVEQQFNSAESSNMGAVAVRHLVTANNDEDIMKNDIDFKSNLEESDPCAMSALESINRFMHQRHLGRNSLIIVEHIERLKRSKVSLKAQGREGLQSIFKGIWESLNTQQNTSMMGGLFSKRGNNQ